MISTKGSLRPRIFKAEARDLDRRAFIAAVLQPQQGRRLGTLRSMTEPHYLGSMTVRRQRPKDLTVYFCTFTCWNWLNLFKEADAYNAVYAWMHVATAKGFRFVGYVIMPNHAHFLIHVPEGKQINGLLATGKRYMAYDIVAALQANGRSALLEQLQSGLRPSDLDRGQKHRAFKTSSDIKECFDGKMIDQKLRYIHANPVSKKWRLADDAVSYPHSSFAFYTHCDARKAPLVAYQELGYRRR